MRRSTTPTAPMVPDSLQPAGAGIDSEEFYEKRLFDSTDLIGSFAQDVEFGQCRFRAARLAGAVLPKIRLTDCLLERCDWSNARAETGTMERLAATDCRMTGLAVNGGLLRNVTFTDCKIDLTNWRFAKFDTVVLTGCNLTGADFTSTDLRGASFVDCDLTGAQFHHATMRGTRFQRCELAGIGGITNWEGAIVHSGDLLGLSYALAGALGIVVEQ